MPNNGTAGISGSKHNASERIRHVDGEHPSRVIDDIAKHARPNAHIITFANEDPGTGKSTLAFHCSVALANSGANVLAIDLDGERRTLLRALEAREATARGLGVVLPAPRRLSLRRPSASMLWQEIQRMGRDCRFVIIDATGIDTPSLRRAIAMADTLVTPANGGNDDHASLVEGKGKDIVPAHFATMVGQLREELERRGQPVGEWLLTGTRAKLRKDGRAPHTRIALRRAARLLGMRLTTPMPESAAYCDLFTYGLALADLPRIPDLACHSLGQDKAIDRLLAEMRLPFEGLDGASKPKVKQVPIPYSLKRHASRLRDNVSAVAAAL